MASAYANIDLSKVPAGVPPAGVTSNLIDPPSDGYQITICNIVCLIIVITVFSMRMYTRICIVKAVGYDDYCNAVAMVLLIGITGIFQSSLSLGVAKHMWDVPVSDLYGPRGLLLLWLIGAVMYSIAMLCIKLSILLLYRRLFPIGNFMTRWWIITFFTVGYSIAGALTSALQCRPFKSAWTFGMESDYCINTGQFYTTNAVLNIISDLLILALPIPVVWSLNLKLRNKIVLSILFVIGSFSCVISLLRLVFIIEIYFRGNSTDLTWNLKQVVITSRVCSKRQGYCLEAHELSRQGELSAAMLCACIPCLRPLFERYAPCMFSNSRAATDSAKGPYLRTEDTGNRDGRKQQYAVYEDGSQIELGDNSKKAAADITVVRADSDNESTEEILRQKSECKGKDGILVRTSYNVR